MKGVFTVKHGREPGVQTRGSSLHPNNGLSSQLKFTDGLPMARWIAFDQDTTSILRSTLAQGTRIDTLLRGPVDYALARPSAVIAVLPAAGGNGLGIATFRRVRAAVAQRAATEQFRSFTPAQPAVHQASTRAGGFLGLRDEAVFDDEAAQEKKGWWRNFWDE
ncbi:MAG TPA: hypothetical protein VIK39_09040 [Candidatus Angelobacter sp.]|jgi:hypothetical protein